MILQIEHLAMIVGTFVIITAITCFLYIREMPRLRRLYVERMEKERTSYYLDPSSVDDCCDICFGDLRGDLFLSECTCGRIFHDGCSDMVDECPYCRAGRSERTARRVRRMVCPRCGRNMDGSICRCGAVVPRKDGTFDCPCGNRMHISSERCPVCGTRYAPVKNKINAGKDVRAWSSNPKGEGGDTSRSPWTKVSRGVR